MSTYSLSYLTFAFSSPILLGVMAALAPVVDDVRSLRQAGGLAALDRKLHALCRGRGPLPAGAAPLVVYRSGDLQA